MIEDNEGDADLVREYLDGLPGRRFRITHVYELAQALAQIADMTFDLIVSDLALPDSTGVDTITRLHDAAPRIPVVVLSGSADEVLGQRAIQAGAQDFLHKDALTTESLSRALRYATERGRMQNQLRTLVEHNADAIVVIGEDRAVTYINRAAEGLFGRTRADVVGTRFAYPLGDGSAVEIEIPGRDPRTAELRAVPIEWEGQSAWLATIRDITDRKRAEELQLRLNHADRLASIGQLASGVAHEVNNPAGFIRANLETMTEHLGALEQAIARIADDAAPAADELSLGERLAEMRTMLRDNMTGIERISSIVRDLSSFSRIERDAIEPVDVIEVLETACSMTNNEIRHRASLEKRLVPVPLVSGDRGKLAQVFTNLLINAAHAIQAGGADHNRITVGTEHRDNTVVVRISDTGCGISDTNLSRIFDPFFTTKPRGRGTGLGLSLSADIVRDHGGMISVDSKLGEGTTFEVVLPRCEDAPARRVAPSPVPVAPSPVIVAPPPSPVIVAPPPRLSLVPDPTRERARVLVIDDERMLLDAMNRMLRKTYQVVLAEGGAAGVAQLEDDPSFDVVICDLMMPEIDGPAFYQIASERWPQLVDRIVYCSGGAFTPSAKAFLDRVVEDNEVLEKPIHQRAVLTAVATVLEREGRLDAPAE